MKNTDQQETILLVDDSPQVIDILGEALRPFYRVKFATHGEDGLSIARRAPPSLILLDVMMPGLSGHQVCRRLKSDLRTRDVPVIFITASGDPADEQLGLELGAVDYVQKPLNPALVLQRVRIHLQLHNQNRTLEAKVRARTKELEDTRREILRRLGHAGEYRDQETGAHIIRVSETVRLLALASGLSPDQADLVQQAAPMHDIGKIGIPDRILLKPAKLDPDEWEIMKTHTLIGAEIIGQSDVPLLRTARSVALTHHEKWDGSGYPSGLEGESIPLEGRLVALADVYDALTSVRPYKRAWSSDAALQCIRNESGRAFDPALVPLMVDLAPEINRLRQIYRDDPASAGDASRRPVGMGLA